jgi:hypothetical protein
MRRLNLTHLYTREGFECHSVSETFTRFESPFDAARPVVKWRGVDYALKTHLAHLKTPRINRILGTLVL